MTRAHDAASVAAQLATHFQGEARWTPTRLIERFADRMLPYGSYESHQGFCGFDGRHGFDDGYSFMGALQESGWRPLPALGDWPYAVYLAWPARPEDPRYAIASYIEGDFAVELYVNKDAAKARLDELRREAPAP